jgi:ubiquinone/menaquinone biosynthesis C-methylase UbiE
MAQETKRTQSTTIPFDIWRSSGTTEHIGGVFATQRLLDLCHIAPGQVVLDVGCGTGYTACYLAKEYQARVVAIDISPAAVRRAQRRAARERGSDRVSVLCADARQLPFVGASFDTVIIESVLIFGQASLIVSEAHRVLKPGGIFANNELALVGAPPGGLNTLLLETLGIQAFSAKDWRLMFRELGFTEVASIAQRMSFAQQLLSHIRVDGIVAYFAAFIKGLADGEIRRTFVSWKMLQAAGRFAPFVGYHLYVGHKPGAG